MVIADHPLSPSGVGTQTRYFIEALLNTDRYKFICLGGALQHQDYRPQRVAPFEDDWVIYPVEGYGNDEMIRSILRKEKPDVLWFMTDPRFYGWLWEIENEVSVNVPMIYYHVWDNFPAPYYNAPFYNSNDKVVAISKVTHEIVKTVAPDVACEYLPHAVDPQYFKPAKGGEAERKVEAVKKALLEKNSAITANPKKKIFFWNSRNARRKQSGTVIWWFKEFLDEVGHDKACLLMHTDARDPHGQDLPHLIEHLGVNEGQIFLSTNKVPAEDMAAMYNACDYTINISDAEGFGLSALESLSCGVPVIVTMTGGLQEQVTDGKDWFGYGIQPASRSIIGFLQVPYIYEDRISKEDFISTLKKALNLSPKAYKNLSKKGLKHVEENYNFQTYKKRWIEIMDNLIEEHGSWSERKNYTRWHLMEVA